MTFTTCTLRIHLMCEPLDIRLMQDMIWIFLGREVTVMSHFATGDPPELLYRIKIW